MEDKVFEVCIFGDNADWAAFIDFYGASSFVLFLIYLFSLCVGSAYDDEWWRMVSVGVVCEWWGWSCIYNCCF